MRRAATDTSGNVNRLGARHARQKEPPDATRPVGPGRAAPGAGDAAEPAQSAGRAPGPAPHRAGGSQTRVPRSSPRGSWLCPTRPRHGQNLHRSSMARTQRCRFSCHIIPGGQQPPALWQEPEPKLSSGLGTGRVPQSRGSCWGNGDGERRPTELWGNSCSARSLGEQKKHGVSLETLGVTAGPAPARMRLGHWGNPDRQSAGNSCPTRIIRPRAGGRSLPQ